MTKSMTAYGRAELEVEEGTTWLVEIHSVNRKSLDINVHLPSGMLSLDLPIRKKVAEKVSRGKVTVKASIEQTKKVSKDLMHLLKESKSEWEAAAKQLDLDPAEINLSFLLNNLSQKNLSLENDKAEAILLKALESALADFISMREKEGKALTKEIESYIGEIEACKDEIAKEAEAIPKIYRERLTEKLKEIELDEERFMKEIALFAEKSDIAEEVVRLSSHLEQARQLLKASKPIGRNLEFLLQEILREINTIGSKSVLLTVSQHTLRAKAAVEKIREQLQNIE